MTSDTTKRIARRIRLLGLAASLLTFLTFAGNVLYGRFAPSLGLDPALRLTRVPEFLLLVTSATLFIVAALAAEKQAGVRPSMEEET